MTWSSFPNISAIDVRIALFLMFLMEIQGTIQVLNGLAQSTVYLGNEHYEKVFLRSYPIYSNEYLVS